MGIPGRTRRSDRLTAAERVRWASRGTRLEGALSQGEVGRSARFGGTLRRRLWQAARARSDERARRRARRLHLGFDGAGGFRRGPGWRRREHGGDDRGAGAAGVTRSRAALGGACVYFLSGVGGRNVSRSVKPTAMLSFAGMPIAAVQR